MPAPELPRATVTTTKICSVQSAIYDYLEGSAELIYTSQGTLQGARSAVVGGPFVLGGGCGGVRAKAFVFGETVDQIGGASGISWADVSADDSDDDDYMDIDFAKVVRRSNNKGIGPVCGSVKARARATA